MIVKEVVFTSGIKECYTIGVDFSANKDYAVLAISKREDGKVTLFNTFYSEEAEEKYKKFIELFGINSETNTVIIPKSNNN